MSDSLPVGLSQISSVSVSKWSQYFNPSKQTWGNYPTKPSIQTDFETQVKEAAVRSEQIDPFLPNIETGSKISAMLAKQWSSQRQSDIRPRLFDKGSQIHRLIDTGSMISTTAKKEGDTLNPHLVLQAVNNSPMPTYGFRNIDVKIGRKTYPIKAVIVDVNQEILGMDFLENFKLGLDWIGDEYYIFDRKAQIKKSLSFVTVPNNQLRTQAVVELPSEKAASRPQNHPDWVAFQIADLIPKDFYFS